MSRHAKLEAEKDTNDNKTSCSRYHSRSANKVSQITKPKPVRDVSLFKYLYHKTITCTFLFLICII